MSFEMNLSGKSVGQFQPTKLFFIDLFGYFLIMCTRVGTAYFQLDWCFDAKEMYYKIRKFNGSYDTNEEYEDKVYMAKFTPNFDQEIWKYRALEILGVEEFNWR